MGCARVVARRASDRAPDVPKTTLEPLLHRIADALERLASPPLAGADIDSTDAFVWRADSETVEAILEVNRVPLGLLKGIDRVRDILLANTLRFAKGLPANNALLWGARGMGKSSLVKAVHATVNEEQAHALALVEIHREDLPTLPSLLAFLRQASRRCVLFSDDLGFARQDMSYKSLKAVLEGGLEGRPANVVFYATSNRRHLMPREMMENERASAINPGDAVDEKVSLSDRFGLWLGFHACTQDVYLQMVEGYVDHYGLRVDSEDLRVQAVEWATTRGARSGRVAWQFVQDLAGQLGRRLD